MPILALAGIIFSVICLGVLMGTAYAANPTNFNEWDFNLRGITAEQDPNNLNNLIITPEVYYEGVMAKGSVNLEVIVTDPRGSEFAFAGRMHDIDDKSSSQISWSHPMSVPGEYSIEVIVRTTSLEYADHEFDRETIHYVVEPKGFSKPLDFIVEDTENAVNYKLGNKQFIQNYERLLVSFNLPEHHMFDKFIITNGEFQESFRTNTKELYLQSGSGYQNLQISLVREGNLIPMADAQSEFIDLVEFSAVHQNVCYDVDCKSIDYEPPEEESPEEFPIWILGFLGVVAIIPLLMRKKTNKGLSGYTHAVTPK